MLAAGDTARCDGITLAKHVLLPLFEAGPPQDRNLLLPLADRVDLSAEVMGVSRAVLKLAQIPTDFY